MKGSQICYASREWFDVMGSNETELPNGRWVPARPEGSRTSIFSRLYPAWLVLTGRADALVWMEDWYQRR